MLVPVQVERLLVSAIETEASRRGKDLAAVQDVGGRFTVDGGRLRFVVTGMVEAR